MFIIKTYKILIINLNKKINYKIIIKTLLNKINNVNNSTNLNEQLPKNNR